jgi:transposase
MDYIKGQDRNQVTMLPETIDDLIGQDNPVRVINAFIDGLDMEAAGVRRSAPNETGRPSYDPRDLLKLYVYGYFNKVRSGRKLMTESTRNIELFFLLNRLTPDFRTIADFRKDNAKALRNVFRAFVKVCMKLGLSTGNRRLRVPRGEQQGQQLQCRGAGKEAGADRRAYFGIPEAFGHSGQYGAGRAPADIGAGQTGRSGPDAAEKKVSGIPERTHRKR